MVKNSNTNTSGWRLFGFKIVRAGEDEEPVNPQTISAQDITEKTFSVPQNDDGAINILSGSHSGVYIDFEGNSRNDVELISKYREIAMQPEIESALDDIVNESIVVSNNGKILELNLDDLDMTNGLKESIKEEFQGILKLFGFKYSAHEIFRRWYIDGRIPYHVVIDETRPQDGIKELRYIDPRRLKKVREITKAKDSSGLDIIANVDEYYVYSQMGFISGSGASNMGVRIAKDSIIYVTSGLLDAKRATVLSWLQKSIRPLNQLRMLEDAAVIYRVTRAPERRIFYIDTGTLPKLKAEQYLKSIMSQYRNKMTYSSTTGELSSDNKFFSALEDFFVPRKDGSKGTEITTLPGAQNIDQVQDLEFFQKNLYRALSVPYSRFESATGFAVGRTTEITRDEIKFSKFIDRLRLKFSKLFYDTLRIQCILKGICSEEEWEDIAESIRFDYVKDNNFTELKEAELFQNRLNVLAQADPFVGKYFSLEYVRKSVLRFNNQEIEELDKQIEMEREQMAEIMDHQLHIQSLQQDAQAGGDQQQQQNGNPNLDVLDHDFSRELPPKK